MDFAILNSIIDVLGKVLHHYINPNSRCYDNDFAKELKQLRPDWFER